MQEPKPLVPHIVDVSQLPDLHPTHLHCEEFWCSLGRAVATFGFLEEVLKRAILALTGTYPAPPDEADVPAAVEAWRDVVSRSLVGTLSPLIDTFGKSARFHPDSKHENLDDFLLDLRAAAKLRNIICHGSWGAPDLDGGSVPFYVTGKAGVEQVFSVPVTVAWLDQLRAHTAELACGVVNTVTHMGYQFPGAAGPGQPVF